MTRYVEIYQPELWFFPPDDPPPSKEQRAWWVSLENTANPLSTFVGHDAAVRRLGRIAFQAFARHNRECRDHSFALIGPQSCGKATLARLFGELVGLPFVEIDSSICTDLSDIAVAIAQVLENIPVTGDEKYSSLELQDLGDGKIVIPPCIVFIDEVDQLPKKVQVELRRAIEGHFESNGWKFDSSAVCWIVATTEYTLPDGFDRLTRIVLKPLSVDEVSRVVALHNPDFPPEVCHFIAQHAGTPRDALAFASEVRAEHEMGADLKAAASTVARDWGAQQPAPWANRLKLNGRN